MTKAPTDGSGEQRDLTIETLEATVDADSFTPKPDGEPATVEMTGAASSKSASRSRSTPSTPRGTGLQPGTRVGRYLVVERIGEGAMGQVYAAYDPELDRKVALKILNVGGLGSSKGSTQSNPGRRLIREAKALSQLAHPNVVAVHDVGTLGEEVFVAMEFVAGTDLRKWAQEQPRTWREVLGVYIQAGRGLAAAHAAGLVHRDFKPHNAILGADGRVRVLDFGLATARSAAHEDGPTAEVLDAPLNQHRSNSDAWERLTQTGALLGTPAYMAPEVIQGKGADEKSDQFGFAASLYQGLFGCLPFEGGTLRELGDSIRQGRTREVRGRKVPGWLRRAVLKGLAAEPARRYPTMDAMLDVLTRTDPASRRTRWAARIGAGVATVAAVGLIIAQVADRNAQLCRGAEKNLTGVWDAPRKLAVRTALMGTGVTYAEDTWTRVQDGLDGYARNWVSMHTEACRATHVRGEQSGEMLDLRMGCLQDRLGEVKALVDVFSTADKDVVLKAIPAVRGLMDLSTCADLEMLRAGVTPPKDAQTRQQVDTLRARLDHVRALQTTGKYSEGMETVETLEPQVRVLGYGPLMAEVLLLKGILLSDRGKYADAVTVLEEADMAAGQSRHAQVSALAERELVYVVGNYLQRLDESLMRARYAHVTLLKAGLFEKLGDRFLSGLGMVLVRKGEVAKAIEYQQQALELCTKASSAEQCTTIMINLATANYSAGRLEEALKKEREAIDFIEKAVGPRHPTLAKAMNNYGVSLNDVGRYAEGMQWVQRALAIHEQTLGSDHPTVADGLTNLGNAQWGVEDFEGALQSHRRALEIRTKAFGPDSVNLWTSLVNMGAVYEAQGKHPEAREAFQRCVDLKIRAVGADHVSTLYCRSGVASILSKEGRYDVAGPELEKIIALWSKALGPEHPNLFEPLVSLARVARGRKDPIKERALLEQSLKVHAANKIENLQTSSAHLELAQLLGTHPSTRQVAVGHAQTAWAILEKSGGKNTLLRQALDSWFQQHQP